MKKFTTKLFLFFLGAAAIHAAISIVALRAGEVYKQGAFKVCERKRGWAREDNLSFQNGKKSVVFFGNSVLLAGIRPDTFDEELQGQAEAFNFALPALPVAPAYFVLKDLIQNWGTPDFVIMNLVTDKGDQTGLFDFNAVQGMGFPGEFFSYLVHRKNKVALLNYIFPIRLYTNETVRYVKNLAAHPADIRQEREKSKSILDQMIQDRGYFYIKEQALFESGRLPPDFSLLPPEQRRPVTPKKEFDLSGDPYVKKFLELTKAHDIQVLLIGPLYRTHSQPDLTSPPAYMKVIPERYPHVTVTDQSWRTVFLPNRYFSDKTHVNPEGADLYTKRVAGIFRQAFGLN